MEALVAKAVERLGRKKVWLVVRAVRQLPEAERTVTGVREALRRIRLYLDDANFAALVATFAPSKGGSSNSNNSGGGSSKGDGNEANDNNPFDTAAFVRAFLPTLSPRRQHVVRLVLKKADPAACGFIPFDALLQQYDVMRHPLALTQRDPHALIDEFLVDFEEAQHDGGIATDELAAYYVGISCTTPRDADFELRCIRSFSLDRPKCNVLEEEAAATASALRTGTRRSRTLVHGGAGHHPLYATTAMEYGKECEKAQYNGQFSRNHCFTKYAPMQRGGGATSMNM
ncbi:calcyphosin [Trypanosoma grayi]|uniref:calcyphosin n=1 Tax=Trypanosoma grayi TaxID=71804 RepID=UPI0004F3F231|nr:calcyphosin [Trypanosoma grayi]KEG09752.1 calcyphosin [Trypanosoma grayi]